MFSLSSLPVQFAAHCVHGSNSLAGQMQVQLHTCKVHIIYIRLYLPSVNSEYMQCVVWIMHIRLHT